jgi:hypothetical protein
MVAVFGAGSLKKIMKVNEVIRVGAWSDSIIVLIRRETRGFCKKVVIYKSGGTLHQEQSFLAP